MGVTVPLTHIFTAEESYLHLIMCKAYTKCNGNFTSYADLEPVECYIGTTNEAEERCNELTNAQFKSINIKLEFNVHERWHLRKSNNVEAKLMDTLKKRTIEKLGVNTFDSSMENALEAYLNGEDGDE